MTVYELMSILGNERAGAFVVVRVGEDDLMEIADVVVENDSESERVEIQVTLEEGYD